MSTTDHPIPVRRNVNDPQRPNRPISAAESFAEPPAERTFPPDDGVPLPAITDAERRTAAEKAPKPQIILSTTIAYRGRQITIQATDLTADQFCDLLDKRGFQAPAPAAAIVAPVATPDDLPDGWKLCHKHGAPMRPRNKQNEHWHSHNVGTKEEPLWCKGYKGADSPGFDL